MEEDDQEWRNIVDRDGGENEEDSEEDYEEWEGIVERNGGENEKGPEKAAAEEGPEVCFILNHTGSY